MWHFPGQDLESHSAILVLKPSSDSCIPWIQLAFQHRHQGEILAGLSSLSWALKLISVHSLNTVLLSSLWYSQGPLGGTGVIQLLVVPPEPILGLCPLRSLSQAREIMPAMHHFWVRVCVRGGGWKIQISRPQHVFFLDSVALFKLEPRSVGLLFLSAQVSIHCAYMLSSLDRNKRRPGPSVLRYPDLKCSCYHPSWVFFFFIERQDTKFIVSQGTYLEFFVFSSFLPSKAFTGILRATTALLLCIKYPPIYTVWRLKSQSQGSVLPGTSCFDIKSWRNQIKTMELLGIWWVEFSFNAHSFIYFEL